MAKKRYQADVQPPPPPRRVITALNIGSAAAFAAALLLYLSTLAPSVGFIDCGELSAVANTFGIAHPTGYPLFTLLAGLWALLPLGPTIFRLNLLSAVFCALSVAVLVHLIWHLLAQLEPTGTGRGGRSARTGNAEPSDADARRDRLVSAVFGAVVIGLSATFWSTALVVEVYSLHLLLLSLVLLVFTRAVLAVDVGKEPHQRLFMLYALLLGLSFANHMTTIYLLPALAVAYFSRTGFGLGAWRRLAASLPVFFLGLSPYLYLPLRASSAPALNWGDPTTFERFFWHLSGKQYREWIFSSTEVAGRQLDYFVDSLPVDFAWVGLLFAPLGLLWALRRRPAIGWMVLLLFVVCVAYSINYDIHDIDSYFLLAAICTGLWAAFGLRAALEWAGPRMRVVLLAVAVITPMLMLTTTMNQVSQRGNHLVEDYTHNVFGSLAENALIFSYQWDYWVSASYHYQLVEGLRPDVVVIDKELLRRSFYLTQLRRNHPEVCAPSEAELKAFEPELFKFEHGLPYEGAVIEERYNRLIDSLIDRNYARRPVYLTLEMEPHLGAAYVRVPEGLAFRLYRPRDLPSPDRPVWDDFVFRPFERSNVYVDGLVSAYPAMLTNRGIFLHQAGRFGAAATYLDRALEFDPDFELALAWKQKNQSALIAGRSR